MKQIAALLLSTVALLTFSGVSAAERWGWSDLAQPQIRLEASSWAPLWALGSDIGDGAQVSVVPLEVDPAATKAPGVLSAALPQIDEALDALRTVVSEDPVLLTSLKVRGLGPDDVVGITHSPDGNVTLFVST